MSTITYPPEMLPKADGPAEVVICTGTCDATPPCSMCTVIPSPDAQETAARLAAELASGMHINRDGVFVEGISTPEQADETVQMLRDRPERRALLERMQSQPPVGARQKT